MVRSSQLYQTFDSILLLSHGRALYSGPGSFTPAQHFADVAPGIVPPYQQGYNVADYLLEVASDPPVALFQLHRTYPDGSGSANTSEKGLLRNEGGAHLNADQLIEKSSNDRLSSTRGTKLRYATTFLTQLQHLSGREWKILRR